MPNPKSTRSIRAFHSTVILEALHRCGSCSRAELSRVTKLSPSTLTRIVHQLILLGIVYEEREGESTGGRKPVMIRINYRHMFAVGVQIHRSRIAIALGDLRGTLHHEKTYRPWSLDPPFLLQELSREINNLIDESGIDRDNKLLGVGMAVAGVVDSETGTMLQSINLG